MSQLRTLYSILKPGGLIYATAERVTIEEDDPFFTIHKELTETARRHHRGTMKKGFPAVFQKKTLVAGFISREFTQVLF